MTNVHRKASSKHARPDLVRGLHTVQTTAWTRKQIDIACVQGPRSRRRLYGRDPNIVRNAEHCVNLDRRPVERLPPSRGAFLSQSLGVKVLDAERTRPEQPYSAAAVDFEVDGHPCDLVPNQQW